MAEFKGFLSGLEDDIRGRYISGSALIVAGDFNAKFPAWGSGMSDARGALLMCVVALELWPENIGSVPTYIVGDRS